VDIRSSKVCELGLLNYRAKHVFYSSSNRRFRCHDDYYWASVFEVRSHAVIMFLVCFSKEAGKQVV
jgi:hypothetical protein